MNFIDYLGRNYDSPFPIKLFQQGNTSVSFGCLSNDLTDVGPNKK